MCPICSSGGRLIARSGIGFLGDAYGLEGSVMVAAGLWWFCFAISLACVTVVPFVRISCA
jgi:hypothetical protein